MLSILAGSVFEVRTGKPGAHSVLGKGNESAEVYTHGLCLE